MKQVGRLIAGIVSIAGYFSAWLVVALIGLDFAEAFTRYALNDPIGVAEEFSGYILVGLSFLGAAYTWNKKGHVRVTFLVNKLPPKVSSWLRLATLILTFAFVIGLTQGTYDFIGESFRLQMHSRTYLFIPLQGPHLTLAIGVTLLLLAVLVSIVKAIRNIISGKSAELSPWV